MLACEIIFQGYFKLNCIKLGNKNSIIFSRAALLAFCVLMRTENWQKQLAALLCILGRLRIYYLQGGPFKQLWITKGVIIKERKMSWGPFRIYQPISTASQAQFHCCELWVLHALFINTSQLEVQTSWCLVCLLDKAKLVFVKRKQISNFVFG